MSQISWNPSYPASGSSASEGDDAFRALMTNFATGVGEFVYFPSSAESQGASTASTGIVRLGTARAARVSNVSGSVGNGYLGFETSKGGLWHLGSSWTYAPLGHPAMETGPSFNAPYTYRWVHLYGVDTLTASAKSGSKAIAYGYTFATPPVTLANYISGTTNLAVGVVSGTTNVTSVWSSWDAGAWAIELRFESIGTVAY